MNDEQVERRTNGWKWATIALVAFVVLILTCLLSALWGGMVGFAVGRGAARRAQVQEYFHDDAPVPQLPPDFPFPDAPAIPRYFDQRAWLGVGFVMVDEGAQVTTVVSGSPAESAGILIGDIITEVDKEPVTATHPLDERIQRHNAGDRVDITILRDGRERVISIRLASRIEGERQWDEDVFPFGEPLPSDLGG
jgi:S1-C subfamily serine protease